MYLWDYLSSVMGAVSFSGEQRGGCGFAQLGTLVGRSRSVVSLMTIPLSLSPTDGGGLKSMSLIALVSCDGPSSPRKQLH